jgi:GntR family transcriptional regulator/MocR family aminotransferase
MHFMDKPDPVLSCINLATLRQLEAEWGRRIHPLRFRANFYIDGASPWEELDWVGGTIELGEVRFRVDRRNGRCGATNVNPISAERDMDIPAALRQTFGHKDLGVYLVTLTSGQVEVGDEVRRLDQPHAAQPRRAQADAARPYPWQPASATGSARFICRGCYYIYVEGQAGAHGPLPAFDALGDAWRCPDCGTSTSDFRPYEPELG